MKNSKKIILFVVTIPLFMFIVTSKSIIFVYSYFKKKICIRHEKRCKGSDNVSGFMLDFMPVTMLFE